MEDVPVTIRSGPFLLAWDDVGQLAHITLLSAHLKEAREALEELQKLLRAICEAEGAIEHPDRVHAALINARQVLRKLDDVS
jgi:hypothetical protein